LLFSDHENVLLVVNKVTNLSHGSTIFATWHHSRCHITKYVTMPVPALDKAGHMELVLQGGAALCKPRPFHSGQPELHRRATGLPTSQATYGAAPLPTLHPLRGRHCGVDGGTRPPLASVPPPPLTRGRTSGVPC
jgi:hypothetical protein